MGAPNLEIGWANTDSKHDDPYLLLLQIR